MHLERQQEVEGHLGWIALAVDSRGIFVGVHWAVTHALRVGLQGFDAVLKFADGFKKGASFVDTGIGVGRRKQSAARWLQFPSPSRLNDAGDRVLPAFQFILESLPAFPLILLKITAKEINGLNDLPYFDIPLVQRGTIWWVQHNTVWSSPHQNLIIRVGNTRFHRENQTIGHVNDTPSQNWIHSSRRSSFLTCA